MLGFTRWPRTLVVCRGSCSKQTNHVLYGSDVDPDPHHFGNLDTHPDPNQIKIRIHIKVISWIQNRIRVRINFADDKPKCMEYEPIFSTFSRV
jgi:hypothetical protein